MASDILHPTTATVGQEATPPGVQGATPVRSLILAQHPCAANPHQTRPVLDNRNWLQGMHTVRMVLTEEMDDA